MWMPSLDLATGLWARMRRTLCTLFSRLSRAAQRFWMSRAYFPVLLTMSAAFMAAGEPVYGAAALGCIVIWLLAACPDLLAPVCPSEEDPGQVNRRFHDMTIPWRLRARGFLTFSCNAK